jgi:acyl-CoA synthetase (AMP-forming)/AMP-acid ligase II
MAVDISLGRWFAARARRTPHRRALTFEGTTWTYAELQDRIDHLELVDELPRTPSGKVLKYELRERLA